MLPFELTSNAENDLKEIALYTQSMWGEKQAIRYSDLIDKRFHEIANGAAYSRLFSSRYAQLFVTRCEHHYIFYIQKKDVKPSIIAILHESMNMLSWIEERLNM